MDGDGAAGSTGIAGSATVGAVAVALGSAGGAEAGCKGRPGVGRKTGAVGR